MYWNKIYLNLLKLSKYGNVSICLFILIWIWRDCNIVIDEYVRLIWMI